ncbi:Hypothetical predicted protein, partial [Olea europaea subsp. europaea]
MIAGKAILDEEVRDALWNSLLERIPARREAIKRVVTSFGHVLEEQGKIAISLSWVHCVAYLYEMVMKSLIMFVNVNEKNLEGKTALDILKPENVDGRKILMSAGAREGSSLIDDSTTIENYLKSNYTEKDVIIKFGAYQDFGLSGNMRNVILVPVVLIATAAFQAALTPPLGISNIDNTPVFPSITCVDNATTSTNFAGTNSYNKTPRIAKISIIFNTIAFGLAMGTCFLITLNPLQLFLFLPLLLFSASYAALAYGIYPGTEAYFLPFVVGTLILLPFSIIIPWKMILLKGLIDSGENYNNYNLDEVKYLIF